MLPLLYKKTDFFSPLKMKKNIFLLEVSTGIEVEEDISCFF